MFPIFYHMNYSENGEGVIKEASLSQSHDLVKKRYVKQAYVACFRVEIRECNK